MSIEQRELMTVMCWCGRVISRHSRETLADHISRGKDPLPTLTRDTPLSSLDWSIRARNCLENAKITTAGQLMDMSLADLLKTKNFGRKSIAEVYDVFAAHGVILEQLR